MKFLWKCGVLTCGIRAQGSNTRPWWIPSSFSATVNWTIMLTYFCLNVIQERIVFWSLIDMYGKAGRICRGGISSYWTRKLTKRSYTRALNYKFFIIVTNCKRLKNWNGVYKARKWKDSKAQEELNQILIEKFQTEGRGRRSELEDASHQRKYKKMKHTKTKSS